MLRRIQRFVHGGILMLYLYAGVTPSLNNKFFYYTDTAQIISALSSYLVETSTIDNYRINVQNVVKVTLNSTLTETAADTVTYIIDYRTNYWRCYHVNAVKIQSGFAIYECSVDLWNSYFHKATISNVNVNRCNRNIGIGIYDDIRATYDVPTRSYVATTGTSTYSVENDCIDRSNVYIVFALKYNVQQNNSGSVSHIKLFAFKIYDLIALLFAGAIAGAAAYPYYYSMVNPVFFAIDVVSGIYGVEGQNMWGGLGTLNASVLNAWITDCVAVISQSDVKVQSNSGWTYGSALSLQPYEVIMTPVRRSFTLSNDADKQLYFGTFQHGFKLTRTTESAQTVQLTMMPSQDKLKFILAQGDKQEDITDAFAVTVGTTDGDITTQTQVLNAIQNGLKAVSGAVSVAKGFSSGGEGYAAVMGLQNMTSNIASELQRYHGIGNMIGGGDGATAYYRIYTGTDTDNTMSNTNLTVPVTNPYMIVAYSSIDDESANVRLYGATFSEQMSIADVFNYSLLGSGTVTDTYLRASCNVDGVPADACDFIKTHLLSGVYLVQL